MGQLNQAGLDLIRHFESCVQRAYPDPATGDMPWTIGYGHTGPDVIPDLYWSRRKCDETLIKDCQKIALYMHEKLHLPPSITDNQFSAMLSFAFNAGPEALAKVIDKFGIEGFPFKIQEYVYAGPKGAKRKLKGLVERRFKEAELFNTPMPQKDSLHDKMGGNFTTSSRCRG